MQFSGHRTRSVFERYHIVSDGSLRLAASRLDYNDSYTNGYTNSGRRAIGDAEQEKLLGKTHSVRWPRG